MSNTRISEIKKLASPRELIELYPLLPEDIDFVKASRNTVEDILVGKDPRLLVIVGPCSIHDYDLALDYGQRLAQLRESLPNLFLVMRVYFEKPRTRKGWKGFVYDPGMDESFRIDEGLTLARKLLLQLTKMRIPIGTECLDTITPQYLADLVSWGAIGARTSESQIHRQLASGLSMPIGFKNLTSGDYEKAIDGIIAATHGHNFLGIDEQGLASHIGTEGNPFAHLILRGGKEPNYKEEILAEITQALRHESIQTGIIVDCSHGNSQKEYMRQILVALYVQRLFLQKCYPIRGIMLESNIRKGSQSKPEQYGVSITDACIDIDTTATLLRMLNKVELCRCDTVSDVLQSIGCLDEQIYRCFHGEPCENIQYIESKYHMEEDVRLYEVCRGFEHTERLLMLMSTRLSFSNRLAELKFESSPSYGKKIHLADPMIETEIRGLFPQPLFPAMIELSKKIQTRCLERMSIKI